MFGENAVGLSDVCAWNVSASRQGNDSIVWTAFID